MNFKRKLWWAQHKNEVYKYGTILSLVLIVTISIIYFTYSKFSSTNEATVEPFIKNDDFIASYIDGEWSNEIPGKNDGYIVDKIVCDNGATGTWNNEEWGINIRNATKKIKCSVYFIVRPTTAKQIEALAATDTTNFATDDADNNIRYIGANPNNYVYFNCSDYSNQSDSTCEKWRIIGVFKNVTKEDGTKEDLVKIIRDDNLGSIAWDSNSNRANDWSTATLQTTLNGEYYNGTYATGALKNDLTRNAIESVVWNLGGSSTYEDVTASMFYERERGTTVCRGRPTTWTGRIALMYPSDYGYASSGNSTTDRASCLSKEIYNWGSASDCYNNDYLFKNSYHQWTLTPSSSYSSRVLVVGERGIVGALDADSDTSMVNSYFSARPVVFLKSNISITGVGIGTAESPFQLKVG